MDIADRVIQLLAQQEAVLMEATRTVLGRWELGGKAEVCTALGCTRQNLDHWIAGRRSPDPLADPFPDPVLELDATPVWDLVQVGLWGVSVGLLDLAGASSNEA
jgi:hypothetical protein